MLDLNQKLEWILPADCRQRLLDLKINIFSFRFILRDLSLGLAYPCVYLYAYILQPTELVPNENTIYVHNT
jgi:hypothetical protein